MTKLPPLLCVERGWTACALAYSPLPLALPRREGNKQPPPPERERADQVARLESDIKMTPPARPPSRAAAVEAGMPRPRSPPEHEGSLYKLISDLGPHLLPPSTAAGQRAAAASSSLRAEAPLGLGVGACEGVVYHLSGQGGGVVFYCGQTTAAHGEGEGERAALLDAPQRGSAHASLVRAPSSPNLPCEAAQTIPGAAGPNKRASRGRAQARAGLRRRARAKFFLRCGVGAAVGRGSARSSRPRRPPHTRTNDWRARAGVACAKQMRALAPAARRNARRLSRLGGEGAALEAGGWCGCTCVLCAVCCLLLAVFAFFACENTPPPLVCMCVWSGDGRPMLQLIPPLPLALEEKATNNPPPRTRTRRPSGTPRDRRQDDAARPPSRAAAAVEREQTLTRSLPSNIWPATWARILLPPSTAAGRRGGRRRHQPRRAATWAGVGREGWCAVINLFGQGGRGGCV
jgi:hypothetical protein